MNSVEDLDILYFGGGGINEKKGNTYQYLPK